MRNRINARINRGTSTTNNTTSNTVLAATVMNNTYSICGKNIGSVPVETMDLDFSYQRVLGSTVKALMKDWKDEDCDFLEVSYRDNKFYIIDGQHRYTVAKAKGITSLPCIIFTGLTREQEALRFARQQDNVNKLTPYDTFKANVACGDESIPEVAIDMKIKRVCDKYGIQVKKYGNNMGDQKVLRCLANVRKYHEKFEWIMDVINASNWANCPQAYKDSIYNVLKTYHNDNKDNLSKAEQNIIHMMNTITPDELETMAKYEYPEYKLGAALTLCVRDLTR
jgi:hypothetical protein